MRDEIDPHALRADQPDHLLDLVEQRLRGIVEQEVRLVEEEYEAGLVGIAHLGQRLEQFGQEPEQESRVELRALHQAVGRQDIDIAAALFIAANEVVDFKGRFTEKPVRALAFERQQLPLDRADAGLGYVAVLRRQFARLFAAGHQHLLEVVEVDQQQAVVVGIAKGDHQDAFLGIVQAEQAGQEEWAHFRDRGADRMAFFPVQVPENRGIIAVGIIGDAELLRPRFERGGVLETGTSGHRDAGEVALHVGQEHRDPLRRELFGHPLKRNGFPGSGGPRDQPVAVGAAQQQGLVFTVRPEAEEDIVHDRCAPSARDPAF